MYRQQDQQHHSRPFQSKWGDSPPPPGSRRPSLLDTSGNLSDSYQTSLYNSPDNRGPHQNYGTGLLQSPSRLPRNMSHDSGHQQEMFGQTDSNIDDLVAAKVRLQQAMLANSPIQRFDNRQQDYHQQGRPQHYEQSNPHQDYGISNQDRQQNYQHGGLSQLNRNRLGRDMIGQDNGGMRGDRSGRRDDRGDMMGDGGSVQGGNRGGMNRGQRGGMRNVRGRQDHGGRRGQDYRDQNRPRKRSGSEIYDPANPTDEDSKGYADIGRPVDDLQVTIKQQHKGRNVVDDIGPVKKKYMQSQRGALNSGSSQQGNLVDANKSDWFCHVCSVSCRNIMLYQDHMNSNDHLRAMDTIREAASFQSDQAKKRLEAELYLRKIDGSGPGPGNRGVKQERRSSNSGDDRDAKKKFCRECRLYFSGERIDHIKLDSHKEAKKRLNPHCKACDMTFRTTHKYVAHCKSDLHKQKRDEQAKRLEGKPSKKDENFVTVDAVGFEDDAEFNLDLIELQLVGSDVGGGGAGRDSISGDEMVAETGDSEDTAATTSKEQSSEEIVIEDVSTANVKLAEDRERNQPESEPQALPDSEPEVLLKSEPEYEPEVVHLESEPEVLPESESEVVQLEPGPDIQPDPDLEVQSACEPEIQPSTDPEVQAASYPEVHPDVYSNVKPEVQPMLDVKILTQKAPSIKVSSSKSIEEPSKSDVQDFKGPLSSEVVTPGLDKAKSDRRAIKVTETPDCQVKSSADESTSVTKYEVVSLDAGKQTVANPGAASTGQQVDSVNDQTENKFKQAEPIYDPKKSVGADYLVPVSGFFCKLCHKFLTSSKASRAHCQGKGHFQAYKMELKKSIQDGDISAENSDSQSIN